MKLLKNAIDDKHCIQVNGENIENVENFVYLCSDNYDDTKQMKVLHCSKRYGFPHEQGAQGGRSADCER